MRCFERMMKVGSGYEHVCLWALCEGNLEGGGSFTEDPEGYVKEGSGDISLHRGPVGEPEGGLIYCGL